MSDIDSIEYLRSLADDIRHLRQFEDDPQKLIDVAAELERLRSLTTWTDAWADAIKKTAFAMAPPNPYTPQFVEIALLMKRYVRTIEVGNPLPPPPETKT